MTVPSQDSCVSRIGPLWAAETPSWVMFVSVNHWLKPHVFHCRFVLLRVCPPKDCGVTTNTITSWVEIKSAGFLAVRVTGKEPSPAPETGTARKVQLPRASLFKARFESGNRPGLEEATVRAI